MRSPQLLLCLVIVACANEPVGRLCDLGTVARQGDIIVAIPSLDCITRTCLRIPLSQELPPGSQFPTGNTGLCSAECDSDADCEGSPDSPCIGGFSCRIATPVGPACCKKLCVCRDYGLVDQSAACAPGNTANTCANLSAR